MASLNRVTLIGNLGRDPEMRYTADGAAITNFSIATTDRWKDKASGEMKEATEWHRISAFGKLAELAGEYLSKGRSVYVEGRLRTRKWQDKEGQDRYTTETVAEKILFLSPRQGGGSGGAAAGDDADADEAPRHVATSPATSAADLDDDIPF